MRQERRSRTCSSRMLQPTKPENIKRVSVHIFYVEPAFTGTPVRLRTATMNYKRAIVTPVRVALEQRPFRSRDAVARIAQFGNSRHRCRVRCCSSLTVRFSLFRPQHPRLQITISSETQESTLQLRPREHSPTTKPFTGLLRIALMFWRSRGRALGFPGGPRGPRPLRRSCQMLTQSKRKLKMAGCL